MKTNVNICLDFEVLSEVKGRGINLSRTINEFLKSYLPSVPKEKTSKGTEDQIKILKAALNIAEKKLEEKENAKVTINC